MQIRAATAGDWAAIWPFFHQIVSAGETYAYDTEMTVDEGRAIWMVGPPGRTVVATDDDGTVLGTATMYANRGGNGGHVASASFMVDPAAAGRGVGRALGLDMLDWARASGFRSVQFNAVVETNTAAVKLWTSIGFEIIGTLPEGFHHPVHGYVGLHIMYQPLTPDRAV
jgi:L-amino acid N-acyltransferase YncA